MYRWNMVGQIIEGVAVLIERGFHEVKRSRAPCDIIVSRDEPINCTYDMRLCFLLFETTLKGLGWEGARVFMVIL